ncbi:MAG: DMT family transporter [Geobacter sp.]
MNAVTDEIRPSQRRVLLMLILTTFFWGGSFLFTKIGLREVPPPYFVLFRFSLATALLALACLPRLHRLDLVTLKRGLIVGTALGITNLTFVFGIQGTSISRAGVINNLFVLFIPLISRIVWRDRIGKINLLGIILACLGIALLASGGGEGFNRGDLFSTLCALLIAVHILSVSKVLKDEDVYLVSLVQFGVVSLWAGTATMLLPTQAFSVSLQGIGAVVYCAIFPTIFCFTLQNRYQRYVTPTQAGLIYTLDPVWSLAAGFLVLGERLTLHEWVGCGLIFSAVTIPLLVRFAVERRLLARYRGGGAP